MSLRKDNPTFTEAVPPYKITYKYQDCAEYDDCVYNSWDDVVTVIKNSKNLMGRIVVTDGNHKEVYNKYHS